MGNRNSPELVIHNNLNEPKCFCCGNACGIYNLTCGFHCICSDCETRSYFMRFTACCLAEIQKDRLTRIRSLLNLCDICDKRIESDSVPICGCKHCQNCIQKLFNSNIWRCTTCNKNLRREDFMRCYVCEKAAAKKFSVRHGCGESICYNCIRNPLITLAPDHNFSPVECPRCFEMFDEKLIIELFGEEKGSVLYSTCLQKKLKTISCPTCEENYLLEKSDHDFYTCVKCSTHFCKACGNNLNSCECQHDFSGSFRTLAINKARTINCPKCLRPFVKEAGVDIRRCANVYCKTAFCAECCSFLSPIEQHGPHYHQRSCKFFRPSGKRDNFSPHCDLCKEFKALCHPPQSEVTRKLSA